MVSKHNAFEMKVVQDFHGQDLLQFLEGLDAKLQRGAFRKMVGAAGTQLAKEIRRQIGKRDILYSRGRNPAERRKSRRRGVKPLKRTIKSRAWSRSSRGIIGSVVGPAWPEGAHGHLVERGHRITGHARIKFRGISLRSLRRGKVKRKVVRIGRRRVAKSGDRTIAHRFQEEAMKQVTQAVYEAMATALRKALEKAAS